MGSSFFLESDRLGFRTWNESDLDLAIGLWGDHNVTEFFDNRGPLSKDQVENRLNTEVQTQDNHGLQYWPIFLKDTEEHVGCAGLRPYDIENGILEIGFHIRSKYWRNGYALEAAKAVINYASKSLNASALFAGHNPKNAGSEKLLSVLGFSYTHDEFYEPTGLNHPSYTLKLKIDE